MNRKLDKSFLNRIQVFLHSAEESILVGLLVLMIAMAVTQIFLRNLFEFGIFWGDILVRTLVLWIGLIGSMVASRDDNHISIDIIARYLPKRVKVVVSSLVELFTAVVCAVMVYYSLRFVKMEFEYGGTAFAQVPAWLCEAIIPFAFAVIALRYFILSLINLSKIAKPSS
jgi:TRAP-type C4-dicarboxylate transport system permease small subunit